MLKANTGKHSPLRYESQGQLVIAVFCDLTGASLDPETITFSLKPSGLSWNLWTPPSTEGQSFCCPLTLLSLSCCIALGNLQSNSCLGPFIYFVLTQEIFTTLLAFQEERQSWERRSHADKLPLGQWDRHTGSQESHNPINPSSATPWNLRAAMLLLQHVWKITESKMSQVGKHHRLGHLIQCLCLSRAILQPISQDCLQMVLEYLPLGRLHNQDPWTEEDDFCISPSEIRKLSGAVRGCVILAACSTRCG